MKKIIPLILSAFFAVTGCKKKYSSIDELCRSFTGEIFFLDLYLSFKESKILPMIYSRAFEKVLSK